MRIHTLVSAMGIAVVLVAAMAVWSQPARAQTPAPQTVMPGNAAIWTDKQQYNLGDAMQVCYRIPIAGLITITDLLADGTSRIFYSGPSVGTSTCLPGVITPPPGHECLRLSFPLAGGTGTTQTCFQVAGPTPPPPISSASITTDRTSYQIGDPALICYRVSGPGPVTITDRTADGRSQVILSDFDDGTGGCLPGTITPPAGVECVMLTHTNIATGGQATAQTCFQVINPAPPPVTGWTLIGGAPIDAAGNWIFAAQVLGASLTYVRVTSGSCDESPNATAVWEGQMLPQQSVTPGLVVLAGGLQPVGLAAQGNSGGWGYFQRPLAPGALDGVSLFLYGISPIYQGISLNVCLRAP